MARRGNGEGSIYQRKDGRWTASISVEGGKRKSIYGKTRKEVQEKLKVALREQQQGLLIATSQQTVAQYLTQWLEDHGPTLRARSQQRYAIEIRLHLIPVLGRHPLQKLTPQQVQGFYTKKLKEGLSPNTVQMLHRLLHKALDDAVLWGLVARNVCDAVKVPHKVRYEFQPLSTEQAHQFVAAVKGHRDEALLVLALTTGMRQGELLALKWQDIDFAKQRLQVRRIFTGEAGNPYKEGEPKTEKGRRSIMLPMFMVDLLKQHRLRQVEAKLRSGSAWQGHDLVFCSPLGAPLPAHIPYYQFKKLLRQAGLPKIRFHDLRHSAATILLSMGVHPKVVQELLGHSQISITMDIYSHVMPTMQEGAMSKLEEEFFKKQGENHAPDEARNDPLEEGDEAAEG